MRKRISLGFLAVLVVASSPVYAGEAMVHVGHNNLDPADLKVAAGDTVVFHNMDAMPGGHTIVAAEVGGTTELSSPITVMSLPGSPSVASPAVAAGWGTKQQESPHKHPLRWCARSPKP